MNWYIKIYDKERDDFLHFTATNLEHTESHISFIDKFGDNYMYHKDMVKVIKQLKGARDD